MSRKLWSNPVTHGSVITEHNYKTESQVRVIKGTTEQSRGTKKVEINFRTFFLFAAGNFLSQTAWYSTSKGEQTIN